jgi:hypothetical protein
VDVLEAMAFTRSPLARIGVMKALIRHVGRVFNPERKDTLGANGS